jgi:hypothetical protein
MLLKRSRSRCAAKTPYLSVLRPSSSAVDEFSFSDTDGEDKDATGKEGPEFSPLFLFCSPEQTVFFLTTPEQTVSSGKDTRGNWRGDVSTRMCEAGGAGRRPPRGAALHICMWGAGHRGDGNGRRGRDVEPTSGPHQEPPCSRHQLAEAASPRARFPGPARRRRARIHGCRGWPRRVSSAPWPPSSRS